MPEAHVFLTLNEFWKSAMPEMCGQANQLVN